MLVLYKPHINFLSEHAVDPDKRRYTLPGEGARHYIDLDHYGAPPFAGPAQAMGTAPPPVFPADNLAGIWHCALAYTGGAAAVDPRLFKEKNPSKILLLSAAIGHYMADAHVPLHANSNHNGQLTGQQGHPCLLGEPPARIAGRQGMGFLYRQKPPIFKNPARFVWEPCAGKRRRGRYGAAVSKNGLSQQYGQRPALWL